MSKVFNAYEKATIKNTAKEVARLMAKKEKLGEQLKDFTEKIRLQVQEIEDTVNQYEANVQNITGGYAASELCEKVNDLWVFKYPDTIVPTVSNDAKIEEKKEKKEEEKVEQNEHLYEEEVTLRDTYHENPSDTSLDANKVEDFEDYQPNVPDEGFDDFPQQDGDMFTEDEFN